MKGPMTVTSRRNGGVGLDRGNDGATEKQREGGEERGREDSWPRVYCLARCAVVKKNKKDDGELSTRNLPSHVHTSSLCPPVRFPLLSPVAGGRRKGSPTVMTDVTGKCWAGTGFGKMYKKSCCRGHWGNM